mmetsp:Transcript_41357/g.75650  ORF Transcript_41357/g.75650 Transcript_41357/m.75650 type:complete len:244 (-) Transcript_41357:211-942(-)
MPPCPSFILLIKKIRHLLPRLLRPSRRIRYHIIRIPTHTRILRHILPLIPILRMSRIKRRIQKERLVLRPRHQEPQRIRLILLRDMPHLLPHLAIMPSILLHIEMHIFLKWKVHPPLPRMTHMIPVIRQYLVKTQFLPIRRSLLQFLRWLLPSAPTARLLGLVTTHVLSGIQGGAADPADGGGDAVVRKTDSVGGEGVEYGGFEDGVGGFDFVVGGESVVGPIVCVEEEDVHSCEIFGGLLLL